MNPTFSSLLEALGLIAVVVGVALFDWRAALIVAGLGLVLLGYLLSAPRPVGPEQSGRLE
jgi:Cu/Ag efflux pump CusA